MAKKINSFQDLHAWQKAQLLVVEIYKITSSFPESESFGLTSQMRRAAVSIPSNLAEGFCRNGTKSKLLFYNIARGSLSELVSQILTAEKLGYVPWVDIKQLMKLADEIGQLISGLKRYFNKDSET